MRVSSGLLTERHVQGLFFFTFSNLQENKQQSKNMLFSIIQTLDQTGNHCHRCNSFLRNCVSPFCRKMRSNQSVPVQFPLKIMLQVVLFHKNV